MRPVAEWPETNLENQSLYRGDVAVSTLDKAEKLIL